MNRRTFIAAFGAAFVFPVAPAAAAEPSEWAVFQKLAAAVDALLHAGDALGETINVIQFRGFLQEVQGTLFELVGEKRRVFDLLQSPTCDPGREVRLRHLRAARKDIGPVVTKLGRQLKVLATAVRPGRIADSIGQVGLEMRSVYDAKTLWLEEAENYCALSPAERTALRRVALKSLNQAAWCHERVSALLRRLG